MMFHKSPSNCTKPPRLCTKYIGYIVCLYSSEYLQETLGNKALYDAEMVQLNLPRCYKISCEGPENNEACDAVGEKVVRM